MIQSFEELEAFKKAYKISLEVRKVSLKFRSADQSSPGNQMRRASQSICANIAEGFGRQRQSKTEFKRFLVIAIGSCDEMRVWTRYTFDFGYIDEATWKRWKDEYHQISKMLQSLCNSLKISDP